MHNHFKTTHNLPVIYDLYDFRNIQEFNNWKSELERKTASKFIKSNYNSKNKITYKCHRSGLFHSKSNNMRRLKMTGSCKINGYCPAAIAVNTKLNGHVKVKYISTHIGHKNDLKYIYLSPAERNQIAEKLAKEMPYEEILQDLQNSDPSRIHLITRKDILNIKKSMLDEEVKQPLNTLTHISNTISDNIDSTSIPTDLIVVPDLLYYTSDLDGDSFESVINSSCNPEGAYVDSLNDSLPPDSIEFWVREFKSSSENATLVYKPQGTVCTEYPNLDCNDFVLFFMTDAQKQLYIKYGGDIVCVDGVKTHNFQLYALLVLDNSREVIPIAFLFCNKTDERVMKLFFEKIKDTVGPIKSNIFMSDIDESIYKVWSQVMGETKMQFYCTWHILRKWKTDIDSKIIEKEKKDQIYKILQSLLCEIDFEAFYTMLEKVKDEWAYDEDTEEFIEYFFSVYVGMEMYKKWAYSCRTGVSINTNMSLENFYNSLNNCYREGKMASQPDETLKVVFNLVRDKLFDIIIEMFKEKIESKLKILGNRHVESHRLTNDEISSKPGKVWQVKSTNVSEVFNVKWIQHVCNECPLQCYHCDSCFHEFICSCVDHGIGNNMCKHIHLVAMHVNEKSKSYEGETLSVNENQETDTIVQNSDLNLESTDQSEPKDFQDEKEDFARHLSCVLKENIQNFDQLNAMRDYFMPLFKSINT
uniref:SWIM-type domain-containing protein n=1 Tax=Clastoptera arizonana TaxID=38151 RepID=A0A1B6DYX6_9HEMI